MCQTCLLLGAKIYDVGCRMAPSFGGSSFEFKRDFKERFFIADRVGW
jgi:hypothetical protein